MAWAALPFRRVRRDSTNGRVARELPVASALLLRRDIAHKQSDQKNGARVSGLSDSKPELENVEQLDELSEGSTLAFDLG